ncbi:N-acetylglucosaminyl-diphospho-decaprenol L-rhamnosyltransferase [Burkholderiaceae bacterium]|nr:N-acetylglucosaminyl-diphospho-decaprenol L-rhamnosyltransferase [Burkholderiaceae bacterium]
MMSTTLHAPLAQRPELSVIVVSWNCAALLADCLRSVRECAGQVRHEVIVVDNHSADDTLAMLARDFPEVQVIANAENTGFARASNQGMAAACAPLLCLLNPDTVLTRLSCLAELKQRMDRHPEIGAAGCRLTFPNGEYQVGDGGHVPTLPAVLSHALLLSRLAPRRFRGLFLQDGAVAAPFGAVGWLCGAFTLVRREVVDRVGGLDPSYFLYGEDVEWGIRMNRAGVLVAYFPDISIIHVQGGTQKKAAAAPPTRWIDGVARVFDELHGGRHWRIFRWSLAFGFAVRAALYALSARGDRARAMGAYAAHVMNLRRTAPALERNR